MTCQAKVHGTATAYNAHRCRCDDARLAHARDEKRRRWEKMQGRPRRVDSTGTVRRLRALMRLGHRAIEIGELLGVSDEAVLQITRRPTVYRSTAERVRAVYDQLSMTLGGSDETRRRAERQGWPPPLSWDDDTIDDPAARPVGVAGHPVVDEVAIARFLAGDTTVSLSWDEKCVAVARGEAAGWSRSQLQRALKLSGARMAKARNALLSA